MMITQAPNVSSIQTEPHLTVDTNTKVAFDRDHAKVQTEDKQGHNLNPRTVPN